MAKELWANAFASLALTPDVLTLRVKQARPTWDEWRELQAAVRSIYQKADAKKMRLCLLFDLLEMGILNPMMLAEWKDLFEDLKPQTERIVICSAMVLPPLIREAVSLFLSSYSSVRKIYPCTTENEALLRFREHKSGASIEEGTP